MSPRLAATPTGDSGPPGLDLASLRAHLEDHLPGGTAGPLTAAVLAGGRSNLTYLVTDGARSWVLRRPPLGHVLATAHDMAREFRVLAALRHTDVPVPEVLLLCQDSTVLGVPFYLMEQVEGVVYRSVADTEGLPADVARAVCLHLVDVLAQLHRVDPAAVGLTDFGRPEGYLERQVRRWTTQLAGSRSRDLPGVEELVARLGASVPRSQRTTIVHGDYRLDNALVATDPATGLPRADDPVTAVLDWEMATLGDPLADLGLFLVYYEGISDPEGPANPVTAGLEGRAGFPAGAELVDRYARTAGLSLQDFEWYVVLGLFKVAVILEGIHFRFTRGQTVGAGFDQIGALVPPLVERALRRARASSVPALAAMPALHAPPSPTERTP